MSVGSDRGTNADDDMASVGSSDTNERANKWYCNIRLPDVDLEFVCRTILGAHFSPFCGYTDAVVKCAATDVPSLITKVYKFYPGVVSADVLRVLVGLVRVKSQLLRNRAELLLLWMHETAAVWNGRPGVNKMVVSMASALKDTLGSHVADEVTSMYSEDDVGALCCLSGD